MSLSLSLPLYLFTNLACSIALLFFENNWSHRSLSCCSSCWKSSQIPCRTCRFTTDERQHRCRSWFHIVIHHWSLRIPIWFSSELLKMETQVHSHSSPSRIHFPLSFRTINESSQTWMEFQQANDRWKHLSSSLDVSGSHRIRCSSMTDESIDWFLLRSRCIRALLKYGANPCLENHLGLTPWNHLSKLNESIQLECLHLDVDVSEILVRRFGFLTMKVHVSFVSSHPSISY